MKEKASEIKCVSYAALVSTFRSEGSWAWPDWDNSREVLKSGNGKKKQKATMHPLVTLPPEIIGSLQLCEQDAGERHRRRCLHGPDGNHLAGAHVEETGIRQ